MSMVTVQANVISLLNMTKDLGETIIDKTDLESFVPGLSDFFIATMKFVTRLIQCDEKLFDDFFIPAESLFRKFVSDDIVKKKGRNSFRQGKLL